MTEQIIKPVRWMGSSKKALDAFPKEVKGPIGRALLVAQFGGKSVDAKPLRGFHGADVVEIVDDFDGDTYRAVYTIRIRDAIYVLHAFQKKSKRGIETPKRELELIQQRLRMAEADAARVRESEKK